MDQFPIEVENHGMTIRGTAYVPNRSRRHPAVLFYHGFTGQRIEAGGMFVQLARDLAARGVAAVTFDFRHSGESDGSFDQMLVSSELSDGLRMTQWLQGQPFADRSRLALLGFSLGGLLAACTMAHSDAYRALTLIAPTTAANLCRHAGDRPDGEPVFVGSDQLHRDFFRDLRQLNPVADVIQHPRPTLLVQGELDPAVAPVVSQAFVDAMQRAGVPVTHRLVPEAYHTFNSPPTRRALRQMVTDWLVQQLTA